MTIALVFVIAFAWSLLSDIIPFLMGLFGTLKDEANIPQSFDLLFLFGEAIGIIGMVIYYRGDHNILPFAKDHVARNYSLGLLFGFMMFSLIWGIITLFGGYQVLVIFQGSNLLWLVLFFFGYAIQSMFEELLCRGYVMGYWLKQNKVIMAVLLNAILFTLLHMANPGFNLPAAIGLFLFAIAMSQFRLLTGSIWLCGAFHAIWNFAEGPIFGVAVSGTSSESFILKSLPTTTFQPLTGGTFGLEASSVSNIVHLLLVILLATIIWKKRRTRPIISAR
ncbi:MULTISPECIES: CPBP family intramembrane glutamic endopeptidase [Lacticaseibacillus]|uniref:Type II CAAX endopeptidase family protein n=2 Tax=Lacticaseibacillus TaxID=2759736 RepID=A0AAN1C621_LACCA|nr:MULTISPECIES: type II CAAX endopeptidase family protein [Lacticaseibacillus]ARY90296.1 hypothetical protein BGL52_00395 [Lacticaseibacillus casei]KAB1969961.1 CPBP family intramembrane metalloprotease [Lacticaseibacillus casei]WLV80910.1 type II CAAX endopeptidase family protein [Lacticaseibacillus sp. NCIMB 15473]WNX24870.1 type II CAAX endopeptidase family protein [Lacticaseibacillus casei]WNX27642.1 type II CAAX endopeptidase family protein [Lacticaseibacillus casei]